MTDVISQETNGGTRRHGRTVWTSRLSQRWVLGGITLAVQLGSFLFLVMVARSTSPATFGGLAALAGIAVLFAVPADALRVVVGQVVASLDKTDTGRPARISSGALLVDTTFLGVAVCALLAAVSPLARSFWHLPTVTPVLLLGAFAVPVGVSVVPKGVLAAQGRLGVLSAGLVGGTAVKLGVGIVLVHRGFGLDGAIGAMVAGELVAAAMALAAVGRSIIPGAPSPAQTADVGSPEATRTTSDGPLRFRSRDAKDLAAVFTGFWLLSIFDVVLARHWLSHTASGWYASAATLAQVALLIPAAVSAIAFPRLVGISSDRQESVANPRLSLAAGFGVVAVVGFVAAAVVSLSASAAIQAIFDGSYMPGAEVVGLLTFSGALFGLVTVLLHYHLNEARRLPSGLCWGGVAVVLVGTSIWHRSMADIAVVALVATATVCLAMIVAAQSHAKALAKAPAEGARLARADAELDLTIVIPYYNPAQLLVATVGHVLDALERSQSTYEVVIVSNSSTDDRLLDQALSSYPRLINVVLPQTKGKGAALRFGLAQGRGGYLGFIDSDGELDPVMLASFPSMVKLFSPDIILGSKRHPLSEVGYPRLRRLYSWCYHHLVHLVFRLDVTDTHAGVNFVRRDVLAAVLPRMLEKRFAFDLELFVVARRLGYKRLLEAPIKLGYEFTSMVSLRSAARLALDTLAIWYRLHILHHYDRAIAAPAAAERIALEPVVLHGSVGPALPPQAV